MDVSGSYVFIEDGNLFMNISPNNLLNSHLLKKNEINTNRKYRKFLQKNALMLQEVNFKVPVQEFGRTIPYSFSSVSDTSRPTGYEYSVPKQKFLSDQYIVSDQTRHMFDTFTFEPK
jgi:hypothetical protein